MELEGLQKELNEVTALVNNISEDVARQDVINWAIGQEESWESLSDMNIVEHILNE